MGMGRFEKTVRRSFSKRAHDKGVSFVSLSTSLFLGQTTRASDGVRITSVISARSEEQHSAHPPCFVGPVPTVLNNRKADLHLR